MWTNYTEESGGGRGGGTRAGPWQNGWFLCANRVFGLMAYKLCQHSRPGSRFVISMCMGMHRVTRDQQAGKRRKPGTPGSGSMIRQGAQGHLPQAMHRVIRPHHLGRWNDTTRDTLRKTVSKRSAARKRSKRRDGHDIHAKGHPNVCACPSTVDRVQNNVTR